MSTRKILITSECILGNDRIAREGDIIEVDVDLFYNLKSAGRGIEYIEPPSDVVSDDTDTINDIGDDNTEIIQSGSKNKKKK